LKEAKIFVISDSIGETAQKIVHAVLAQFPEHQHPEIKRFPFVTADDLSQILADALAEKAIVVTTLVDERLRSITDQFVSETGLSVIDYIKPLSDLVAQQVNQAPIGQPGIIHQLDQAYYNRVAAIEFAVRYDDGKDPRGFKEADIVLLGISRTSKTPLSMYLANHNLKVANLPLVPEVPVPKELYEIPSHKLFGLTTTISKLSEIRNNRLQSLGLPEGANYATSERIQAEIRYANTIFETLGCPVINVDNRSIEEVAMLIQEKGLRAGNIKHRD
jgi:regulator of PEP synthase PpsR (kinase-PPPase family)